MTRADLNNNPTAFTTDIAREAGLIIDKDYSIGTAFTENGRTYYTAKLLKDPINLTIQVIDTIGFKTKDGSARWDYIDIPFLLWKSLTSQQKIYTIGTMYHVEGGTKYLDLFPTEI